MWALAVIAPIAVALSHPAVFVAGGIMLGLLPSVVQSETTAGLDCLRDIWPEHRWCLRRPVFRLYQGSVRCDARRHAGPMGGGIPAAGRPREAGRLAGDGAYREHVRLSLRGRARREQPDSFAVRGGSRRVVDRAAKGDLAGFVWRRSD